MGSLSLISFKVAAAFSILVLTITAGIFPLKYAKKHSHFLCLGDAFASGVFLSAALLHLLPDASSKFIEICGQHCYPFAQLICIAAFMLLLIMERGMILYGKKHLIIGRSTTPILLIILLTVHSLVEGAAIGINASIAGASIIFIAVIAHKGSESFALASKLHRYFISTKKISSIIILFSLMTPLGLLIASIIRHVLETNSGGILEGIFNAVAAGTFLYLGTEHMIEGTKSFDNFDEIIALICGIASMAIVAIWV